MIHAAMLKLIQDSGEGLLVLIDGLTAEEFHRSRLTRQEVRRLLLTLAQTLVALPDELQQAMPEIDWDAWQAVATALPSAAIAQDELAWDSGQTLVPFTLSWLRLYRSHSPQWFAFTA